MANSLSIAASVNGNINGLAISQAGNASLVPTGSIALAESVYVNTGSYQQVVTGSGGPFVASVIYSANTSPTGSIALAVSYSGIVASLGTIGPSNGTQNNSSLVQWNQPFTSLWAQATVTQSYGVFVVATQ